MNFWLPMVYAIGVSADAVAVSVCKGISVKKASWRECAICGVWFGAFQALMPLLGYFFGSIFADVLRDVDHWIAFGLLALIGGNMIKETFEKECCQDKPNGDFSFKTMLLLAVATSVDAAAVGMAMISEADVNIYVAVAMIGVTTCLLSAVGVKIGRMLGHRFNKVAQFAGGAVLILLGIKILVEHLTQSAGSGL